MSSKPWTSDEIDLLKKMVQDNCTKTEIAYKLNRTITAVQIKCSRLGIAITNQSDNEGSRGRDWKQSDIDQLIELWNDPKSGKYSMMNQMRRSWTSIRYKAMKLGLGPREYDTEYLSMNDICQEMQVSFDRVSNWCKIGLKRKKSKSGKTRWLIDVDDLLKFLENHQDLFNASLISKYLFYDEPDWLIEKRHKDSTYYPKELRLEYSNEDDKMIQNLFLRGKSDEYIAKELNRTSSAIAGRRRILGLYKGAYTDDEDDYLRKWSRYKTLDEILEKLPWRTIKGLEWRCKKLNIPYHLQKSCCEIMEDNNHDE